MNYLRPGNNSRHVYSRRENFRHGNIQYQGIIWENAVHYEYLDCRQSLLQHQQSYGTKVEHSNNLSLSFARFLFASFRKPENVELVDFVQTYFIHDRTWKRTGQSKNAMFSPLCGELDIILGDVVTLHIICHFAAHTHKHCELRSIRKKVILYIPHC